MEKRKRSIFGLADIPLEIGYSPAELLMCKRLRTTLPMVKEQRIPKLPDPTVLSKKKDQVKGRQILMRTME